MLKRIMICAKKGINRCLTPWMTCFDVLMPQEVFELLNKGILNGTSYGIEVSQKPGSVTLTFKNMWRLCALFNKFEDCKGFIKDLGTGKGVVKLIVDDRKHEIMRYKFKEEILQFNFHYGYWNAFGITQHWIRSTVVFNNWFIAIPLCTNKQMDKYMLVDITLNFILILIWFDLL